MLYKKTCDGIEKKLNYLTESMGVELISIEMGVDKMIERDTSKDLVLALQLEQKGHKPRKPSLWPLKN